MEINQQTRKVEKHMGRTLLKSKSGKYKVIVRKSKVTNMYLLRAPARQNLLKGTNTRLKQRSDSFVRDKEATKAGGTL